MTRSLYSIQLDIDKLFTSTRSVGPNIRSTSEYEQLIFYHQMFISGGLVAINSGIVPSEIST